MSWQRVTCVLGIGVAFLLALQPAVSQQPTVTPDQKELQKVIEKAIGFLKTSQQADGSFSPKFAGAGITSLVTAALLKNGVGPQEPVVAKSLKFLESNVKPDGGIYEKGLANYTTAVALMALKEGNTDGKYNADHQESRRIHHKDST